MHDVEQEPSSEGWKPKGLWFSVGDGEDSWRAWCEENLGTQRLVHCTQIILSDTARVLRAGTAEDIDKMSRDFRTKRLPIGYNGIDWPRVARRYDAVIIAPYCWERRLHDSSRWYYTWDCASGCVWRADAVAELRPLNIEKKLDEQ